MIIAWKRRKSFKVKEIEIFCLNENNNQHYYYVNKFYKDIKKS